MFENIGELLVLFGRTLQALPQTWRQRRKVYDQLFEIGNASLLMACILSLFIGGVIALQTGPLLAERGLATLIGSVVGNSMCKELAAEDSAVAGYLVEEVLNAQPPHIRTFLLRTSILDRIADWVNKFCGSMYVFIGITIGIVAWLFLGNVVGFDKTPWPLLLTILNLPQLSIMISLQVSANRAQAASDRRAIADHETLIALHEMAKQQLDILNGQDRVLAILDNFASKDMPGRQAHIQDCVDQILAKVDPKAAAG